MKVIINGKECEVRQNALLSDVLNDLKFDPSKIVVERNLDIVKKDNFDGVALQENDRIEILRFVGGG